MKKNMGSIDKALRVIVALVIAILFFTGKISGTSGMILLILGGVFLATSFLGTCPLYLPFNIDTTKKENK